MAESANKEKKQSSLKNFWAGVKSEYKKISWPDKDSLWKQSVAVVIITIVVGVIITVLDFGIQYGVNFLTSITF